MYSSHSNTLKFILFFAVVALSKALQCSDCPAGNSCCVDYLDGARCYNPAQAKCASTQQTGSNGASTYRLCGLNDSACGSNCYDPRSYYCCAGQLKQNSQPCDSNAATQTVAPTSAPTQSPTSATTQAPAPAPTTAAPKYNCMAIGGQYGVNCSAGETCCGAQTMSPSCLPANGSKICCQYYLSATQCNPDQVCGGQLGSGASSNAQCGPPNSTFCFIGFQLNTFCSASQPVCCGQGTSYAFCCAAGATCNNTGGTCVPKPSTTAPTVTPPVSKSPVTAQPNNTVVPCPGVDGYGGQNCSSGQTCCGYGKLSTFCLNSGPSEEYKCCTWYLSAAKCKKNEVCGGSGGVGASSYAQCGPPGSVFCNKGTAQNSFCSADQKCCGVEGERSFCCGANQACNNTNLTCSG